MKIKPIKLGMRTVVIATLLAILMGIASYFDFISIKNILRLQPLTLCVSGMVALLLWGCGLRILGEKRWSQFFMGLAWGDDYAPGKVPLLRVYKTESLPG